MGRYGLVMKSAVHEFVKTLMLTRQSRCRQEESIREEKDYGKKAIY